MKIRTILPVAALAFALLGAGCATQSAQSPPSRAPQSQQADSLVQKYGLQGKTPEQIVESLDQDPGQRPLPLAGSVRPNELILSDGKQQETLRLAGDKFYLSVAPYMTRTHECFNHNLGTCQGELVSKSLKVTITDAAGTILVSEQTKTYANGFVAFWIPRDLTGTVRVESEGKSGGASFSSRADGATCMTTLKLT